jgi:hypothetical protein
VADEDRGGRTGKAFDRVMLGEPETPVTPLLNMLRKVNGTRDGRAGIFSGLHSYEVED